MSDLLPSGGGYFLYSVTFSVTNLLLSLDSVFGEERLLDCDLCIKKRLSSYNVIEYVSEPKLDRIVANLLYENGLFVRGAVCEHMIQNIRTIDAIPLTLLVLY